MGQALSLVVLSDKPRAQLRMVFLDGGTVLLHFELVSVPREVAAIGIVVPSLVRT